MLRKHRKTVRHAYEEGKNFMNRDNKSVGTTGIRGTEDRRFRSFFGCPAEVFICVWEMIVQHQLIPPGGHFTHLFWAFLFMKLYPKNEIEFCGLLGGIDPKTMRKWVWPFIRAVAELHFVVVSKMSLLVELSFRIVSLKILFLDSV